MNIKYVSPEAVIAIHTALGAGELIVAKFPDLQSAVAAPMQNPFGGGYQTVPEKAGCLLRGVATAHAFTDGNKRVAFLAMTTMLELNGLHFRSDKSDEVNCAYVVHVLKHKPEVSEIANWIVGRIRVDVQGWNV